MVRELRVAGLAPHDAGRGIARLGTSVLTELGIEPGDVVQITGRRRTVAKAMPAYEGDPDGILRIDGNIRSNAGVAIDDSAEVTTVEATPAESITVALPQ